MTSWNRTDINTHLKLEILHLMYVKSFLLVFVGCQMRRGESSHSDMLGHLITPYFVVTWLLGQSLCTLQMGRAFNIFNPECVYILQIGNAFRDDKNQQDRDPCLLDFSVHSSFNISVPLFLLGVGAWYLGVLPPDSQRVTHWGKTC